ncbi:MAG: hypothetical protein CMO74_15235 [Verrucomicrobiales bacterium]|nr:hypothetical protein [Verrucomicrobiales bacterium]MBL69773.1 hypothetical protein [Verrucomicrobiales bacterium]|tara:strand:- start:23142 stop:23630 length:489 start_codon:yes stop_codon:yes gene_type:complete
MKLSLGIFMAVGLVVVAWADDEADSKGLRQKEAARYLKALPPEEFVGDMIFTMAQNFPAGQRKEFIDNMTRHLDFKAVEEATLDSLVRHLTAKELSALADFYSTPVGKSAMKKIGVCMKEMGPHIQLELQKAFLKTSQSIGTKPGLNLPLPRPAPEKGSPKK